LPHVWPGPLAGYYVHKAGVNVIKIEDQQYPDPFSDPNHDDIFYEWYKTINSPKEIIKGELTEEFIKTNARDCDCLLIALPEKVIQKLKLRELNKPRVEIHSSQDFNPVHDLNLFFASGLMELQSFHMPALPFAGVQLAHVTAQNVLAAMQDAQRPQRVIYADKVMEDLCDTLWPISMRQQNKFLHNGRFPCYNVYQTKDCKNIALAAVEEKFWATFCELFKTGLSLDDRFNPALISKSCRSI
jgi:alpha-methylacyl-CoA racemase